MRRSGILAMGMAASLAVFAYAFARYGDSVFSFFFLDDFRLLADAAAKGASLGETFGQLGEGTRLYRPLTQEAYFAVLGRLFGTDATAYHAVQLSAFAINCVLVLLIARQLVGSWLRALAAALLYAAAPGHAVAVFWVAAFTMIGTASVMFATIAWWLWIDGRARVVGGTVMQAIGLLCSEHAVVLPPILFLGSVLGPRRETARAATRALLPLLVVVGGYLLLRLAAVASVGLPQGPYAPRFDAFIWLASLGRYAAAAINLLTLAVPSRGWSAGLGAGLLFTLLVSAALAWRGVPWARLPALGLTLFATALLPVLPLTQHYYDYYVGVAALGMAIALVGLGDLTPRWSGAVATLLATAVIITDAATCDGAARENATLQEVRAGQAASSDLLLSIHATQQVVGPARELIVNRSPLTDYMIDAGGAYQVFFESPVRITVAGGRTRAIGGEPPPMLLVRADPDEPPFWWHPTFAWMRLIAFRVRSAYVSLARGCD